MTETRAPVGRPSKYSPAYAEEVITYCAQGYSLTAFAGSIGVCRRTIAEWSEAHPEFLQAVSRAKAKRAEWWETKALDVATNGGTGGRATMVIFGLKNHAPEDFREVERRELTGKDGGPIEMTAEDKQREVEARRQRAQQFIAEVLGDEAPPGASAPSGGAGDV
jgi:hypothetical protein